MALKNKEISIYITPNSFETFFRKFSGDKKKYDFSGISDLRKALNNEKARIIHTIKTNSPDSIYTLAKILGRDFKAVRKDLEILKRFGLIYLTPNSKGNRKKLKPEVAFDELIINLKFR